MRSTGRGSGLVYAKRSSGAMVEILRVRAFAGPRRIAVTEFRRGSMARLFGGLAFARARARCTFPPHRYSINISIFPASCFSDTRQYPPASMHLSDPWCAAAAAAAARAETGGARPSCAITYDGPRFTNGTFLSIAFGAGRKLRRPDFYDGTTRDARCPRIDRGAFPPSQALFMGVFFQVQTENCYDLRPLCRSHVMGAKGYTPRWPSAWGWENNFVRVRSNFIETVDIVSRQASFSHSFVQSAKQRWCMIQGYLGLVGPDLACINNARMNSPADYSLAASLWILLHGTSC